jgi:hypothetical protein
MVDIFLHGAAAVLLCSVFVYATTPWKFMAVSNAVFWYGREVVQRLGSGNNSSWSLDKHLEWFVPAVLGVATSYVVHRIIKSRRSKGGR